MFENYTYKLKFKVLIVLILILSIAAYRRSFSVLWQNYKQYSELKTTISKAKQNSENLDELQQKLELINKNLGSDKVEHGIVQQNLVQFVALKGEGVSLNSMTPIHEFNDQKFVVNTYQIDLTGTYNGLIKILHLFESSFEYSKIVSADFIKIKKNKKEQLHLNLIFQNYESK